MDDETLPSNIGVKRGRPKNGLLNVWLFFTKYGDDSRCIWDASIIFEDDIYKRIDDIKTEDIRN